MTDAELAALADADPRTLPAADLLDGYVDALRRAPLASPGPELGRAVALRAELLGRLADRDRLAGVVRRALEAGHCHPAAGSDAGECLVDHCTLTLRDLIALREANARLLDTIVGLLGGLAALRQIEADARASLAPPGADVG